MKNFVKNFMLFAIAVTIAFLAYPQYSMGKTIKFAQLSDMHVSHRTANSGNRMHINSFELAQDAISQVNLIDNLDFVVITGDGVDSPKKTLLEEFGKMLSTLKKPYYYSLGNHDTSVDLKKEKSIKILAKYNPYNTFKTPYYSTTIKKDFKIIILDGSVDTEITSKGNIGEEQLKWLDSELSKSQDKVVLIFTHFPVVEPFSSHNHRIKNADEVESVLKKYDMPIAVFSGHYHATRIIQKDNILHASSPAMIMYPNAFRVVTVHNYKDRVDFDFDYKETNLKSVQKTSKLLTLSGGLAYGVHKDRINTITIFKKEQKNVQK